MNIELMFVVQSIGEAQAKRACLVAFDVVVVQVAV